jgi:hypothetical protein
MGFTGFCPAAKIMAALGLKEANSACGTSSSAGKCC